MPEIEEQHILIVDDRPENLIALEGILQAPGRKIVKASSGKEALWLIMKSQYALIILDVQMPEMDGFETAELIRGKEKFKYIPIIFVTAINKEQKHVFKGYEVGAVDCLFKPIEPEILQSKVHVFLELYNQKKLIEKQADTLRAEITERKSIEKELRAVNETLEQRVEERTSELKKTVEERNENIEVLSHLEPTLIDPPTPAEDLLREEVLINPLSLCRAMRTGKPYITGLSKIDPSCSCIHSNLEASGFVCYPLNGGGKTLGLVQMVKYEKSNWDVENIHRLFPTYLGLTIAALLKVRLMDTARHAAITDSLTGLYNRRFWDEMLCKQVALSERHNKSLSLLLVDLDHFKDFNDTYGHQAGDTMLQQVTTAIRDSIRTSDILARYGGEEFAILMPTTDLSSAVEKAESIRLHIETNNFNNITASKAFKITISIGVATLPEHGTEPNALTNAADKALYKAKNGGRNRVETP